MKIRPTRRVLARMSLWLLSVSGAVAITRYCHRLDNARSAGHQSPLIGVWSVVESEDQSHELLGTIAIIGPNEMLFYDEEGKLMPYPSGTYRLDNKSAGTIQTRNGSREIFSVEETKNGHLILEFDRAPLVELFPLQWLANWQGDGKNLEHP